MVYIHRDIDTRYYVFECRSAQLSVDRAGVLMMSKYGGKLARVAPSEAELRGRVPSLVALYPGPRSQLDSVKCLRPRSNIHD